MNRKKTRPLKSNSPLFILAGVALLVVAVLLSKNSFEPGLITSPQGENSATPFVPPLAPQELLDQALEQGQPVLAFFHSLTCTPCLKMTEIVAEVYPEFESDVVLVDVDVYDRNNETLLRRASIRTIPTVVFIDRSGQGQTYFGVIPADELRAILKGLAYR
jgi:thiol-disulfide isomerase/thioredoxin